MANPGSDYEALPCDFSCKAKENDFTDYDYSKALVSLFDLEYLEVDWADDLKSLFASPAGFTAEAPPPALVSKSKTDDFREVHLSSALKRNFDHDYLDEDWAEDLKRLFAGQVVKPFYQLDLDAILAGPVLFGGVPLGADGSSSDEFTGTRAIAPSIDLEEDGIAFYKVRPCKSADKSLKYKSNYVMKCTGRKKRQFPVRRAQQIARKIQRGGYYESGHIEYGSYGPCGYEI